jgi:hypothetical protein
MRQEPVHLVYMSEWDMFWMYIDVEFGMYRMLFLMFWMYTSVLLVVAIVVSVVSVVVLVVVVVGNSMHTFSLSRI